MRVDKVVMGVVVALGGFALYRLVTNKDANAPTDPNATPLLNTNAPGALSVQSSLVVGDPLSMRQATYYRGRLNTASGLAPFSESSTREQIAQGLAVLGFDNVKVFMASNELPSNWPSDTAQGAPASARWFSARWAQNTMSLPRPAAFELAWFSTAASNA